MSASALTRLGTIHGTVLSNGIEQFLGVPFARPPRRFEDPVDWTEPFPHGGLNAQQHQDVCVQPTDRTQQKWIGSEDCLYLNIWRRAKLTAYKSPVLLFIHGGSFVTGGGLEYNSSVLAAKHAAIYVTINYRLGALGFANFAPGHANFGLRDQRSAMRWVQHHIESFGGDRGRVLVFGESAGAISIGLHLLTPLSRGLFHAALMESGMAAADFASDAQSHAHRFSELAGCAASLPPAERMTCLQRAPLTLVCNASRRLIGTGTPLWSSTPSFLWGPSVDAVDVKEAPQRLLRDSTPPLDVPLLAGVNTDEGSAFAYTFLPDEPLSAPNYTAIVRQLIANFQAKRVDGGAPRTANDSVVQRALELYPAAHVAGADNRPNLVALCTDLTFHCSTRRIARALTRSSPTRAASAVYLYRFTVRARDDSSPASWGVSHGSEVPFVFDHGDWVGAVNSSFTPAEEAIAMFVGDAWAHFAAAGAPLDESPSVTSDPKQADPLVESLVDPVQSGRSPAARNMSSVWAPYDPQRDEQVAIVGGPPGARLQVEKSPRAAACDLWTSLGWF